ncbi:hypothetical protein QCD85_04725 [Paenibacillus sp. PsM32]|uniref:hypothetical protein n=1 Tax=Paenibacillus sp. PsM32 TaxID=3030536 RepID=UPI00263A83BF|nr:hypothetical protein [Paenibacillus sp. PsM32]MDN4617387.1 hypothetical protein [Paenibacillus sp. PsM32]
MMFNRFFFNRGLWSQAFRQSAWLSVLYLVGLLMLPWILITEDKQYEMNFRSLDNIWKLDDLFYMGTQIQPFCMMIFPAFIAIFLTRYMQNKKSADLFHSLPFRREQLLSIHILAGILLNLIPIAITMLVLAIIKNKLMYLEYTSIQIWQWGLSVFAISLFIFAFTLFVGICIGQSILQMIVTGILLLLPAVIIMFFQQHFIAYLYGYMQESSMVTNYDYSSPLIRIGALSGEALSQREGWIYTFLAVGFIILSYIFYKLRPSEAASQAIVFRYFNPVFRIGVMFCAAMTLGTYWRIAYLFGSNILTITTYIVGGIIGFIISEMLIRKTWYIFDGIMIKRMLSYGIIVGLIIYLPITNATGYEKRVPELASVQSVYIGDDIQRQLFDQNYKSGKYELKKGRLSSDPNYIQSIISLQAKIVEEQPEFDYRNTEIVNQIIQIAYQLNNGKLMYRSYTVPYQMYASDLQKITSTAEYKTVYYKLDDLQKYHNKIRITNEDVNKRSKLVTNSIKIKELKQLIFQEHLAIQNPLRRPLIGSGATFIIYFSIDPEGLNTEERNYYLDPSYAPIATWLKDNGYWDTVVTQPKDIESIVITKESADKNKRYQALGDRFNQQINNAQLATIQNPQVIKELLDHSQQEISFQNTDYMLKLKFKDKSIAYRVLSSSEVNPEIYKVLPE